jgi:hypothetical protein
MCWGRADGWLGGNEERAGAEFAHSAADGSSFRICILRLWTGWAAKEHSVAPAAWRAGYGAAGRMRTNGVRRTPRYFRGVCSSGTVQPPYGRFGAPLCDVWAFARAVSQLVARRTVVAMLPIALLAMAALAWGAAMALLGETVEYECGAHAGRLTLADAGIPVNGLTVLAGCNEEIASFRGGRSKSSMARGSQPALERSLRSGGVPVSEVKDDPASVSGAGPIYLPSGAAPESQRRVPWQLNYGYRYDDLIQLRGQSWTRSIVWGPASEGSGWLLMVVLETGSM